MAPFLEEAMQQFMAGPSSHRLVTHVFMMATYTTTAAIILVVTGVGYLFCARALCRYTQGLGLLAVLSKKAFENALEDVNENKEICCGYVCLKKGNQI